jgi:hypothetical protein
MKELHRLRTVLHERFDALVIEAIARLMPQIGRGERRILVDSPSLRERGSGDPEPTT